MGGGRQKAANGGQRAWARLEGDRISYPTAQGDLQTPKGQHRYFLKLNFASFFSLFIILYVYIKLFLYNA